MPDWLLRLVCEDRTKPKSATVPAGWHKLIAGGVAEGQRNDAVARLAGMLLRPGPKDPWVVTDLLRCWNAHRCNPPLSEQELVRTVDSICGRELARRQGNNNAEQH